MNIAIVGTGYVGLVSGTCFSEMGLTVTCVDLDSDKIEGLRCGVIPIYEPGLEEMVLRNYNAGRLCFETDLIKDIDSYDMIFCAVGTPSDGNGGADLRHVFDVARAVGQSINRYVVFVVKSTVPVGTCAQVKRIIQDELDKRGLKIGFDVASNPEFLKEGAAVNDFMNPDRVVIGVDNDRAKLAMERLYKPFLLNQHTIIFTDTASSEMIKYASNAMLATRISFMNDIANLCSLLGADVNMVRKGIGSDSRIGPKFLYPGIGYGGSCFPKDIRSLIGAAEKAGYSLDVLKAVERVNHRQKGILFEKFRKHFGGDIAGRTVALWGLSFKPETDDMREAPSLVLIDLLLEAGCKVRACDPIAAAEAQRRLGDKIEYFEDKYEAAEGADALMLATEWKAFRVPDWNLLKSTLRVPVIFDGRNIYDRKEVESRGLIYYSI